ncbi:HEPN domain-containing protein [bacterium]|nr:HEPN domain-containing protein [bacterium]
MFKKRADWFFLNAQSDFERGFFHGAINRSWYSVMLLVTGATYIVFPQKKPPGNQLNWNHKIQDRLFIDIAAKVEGLPPEMFTKYADEIGSLYIKREEADYRVDKEEQITETSAKKCLETASKVRQRLMQLVGEWP